MVAGEIFLELSRGAETESHYSIEEANSDGADTAIVRRPYEANEQLPRVIAMLREALIAPIANFIEAEVMAGIIAGNEDTHIAFIDPIDHHEIAPINNLGVGDFRTVRKLDALLDRLPAMVMPPPQTDGF